MAADLSEAITASIHSAQQNATALRIEGHGSKQHWFDAAISTDEPASAIALDVSGHAGVLDYQPEELVVTARAGTSLQNIKDLLASSGQMLACDPPLYGTGSGDNRTGTVGGAVASGFSGPGRPWCGAIRDAVLGVEMINGQGDYLRFGGQVMKNVAGYDVSRLQAGAWGSLGVLMTISMRAHPQWEEQQTLALQLDFARAQHFCQQIGLRNLPIVGTLWQRGMLYLRLAGNAQGVAAARAGLGGDSMGEDVAASLWRNLRDHRLAFFKQAMTPQGKLWRLVVPVAAPGLSSEDEQNLLVEWGGGLRWLYSDDDQAVRRYAQKAGGWCWQLGGAMPVASAQAQQFQRLSAAFDPNGVFACPVSMAIADAD